MEALNQSEAVPDALSGKGCASPARGASAWTVRSIACATWSSGENGLERDFVKALGGISGLCGGLLPPPRVASARNGDTPLFQAAQREDRP
ncbi:hypothetical protein GCM10010961_30690 [Pseudodonghicola xiamenensis]|uniref:Uncharacterized protein n=1 Tax=Pseudodonghicola xiamenensis TaxID=337702 RepID=A0A8J3MEE9_9RHOB|nr:hypothetical protein GCM10010961_30690 [Pseudodonghicola xiamenensis]